MRKLILLKWKVMKSDQRKPNVRAFSRKSVMNYIALFLFL